MWIHIVVTTATGSTKPVSSKLPIIARSLLTVDCGIADGGLAARIEQDYGCDVLSLTITCHRLSCHTAMPWSTHSNGCSTQQRYLWGWRCGNYAGLLLSNSVAVTPLVTVPPFFSMLGLMAIGTMADCMPMQGENRIWFPRTSLLERTDNPGCKHY